jgi:autotransporter-associated beta strand protein
MKTRSKILRSIIALISALAVTSALSQTTYTWTNQTPALSTTGDLGLATNWNPNAVPSSQAGPDVNGVYGDIMEWSGATTGNVSLTANNGQTGASGSPVGLRIHLTSSQTGSVTIYSPVTNTPTSGTRLQSLLVEPGAGGLILGDHVVGGVLDFIIGGVQNQIQGFTNNSTSPCIINESVRFRMGGGGAHFHVFAGTGDWIINNHLRSANSSGMIIQKDGPGTMTWTGTNIGNNFPDQLGSPITIAGGTMIWKTSDLVGSSAGNPNIVHNGTLFKYDANDGGAGLILGNISGAGPIEMHAGTLNLSGQNTISGNWTLSGGTLIAGSSEVVGLSGPMGQNGAISFSGGTFQYSANNAFDYSSRFSTAASQAIRIDTAGQIVTYATGLTSSGGTLTKLGNGELTLAGANTYDGLTTVSSGTLTLQGPKTGAGSITVGDGATLDVVENGTPVTPATLTVGTSLGANLQFDNVTNRTAAPLAAGAIANNGTVSIGISSEGLSIGKSYPLLTWSSGSAPAVSLGIVDGGGGFLTTNGNTITFNCTAVALVWSGAGSGNWDFSTINWTVEGSPITYTDPKQVVFNDSSTGNPNVTISGVVQPESITINNLNTNYTITSSFGNIIGGNVRFGKKGVGTLTLTGGFNTNTGVTTLKGGTLVIGALANGGSASDIGAASSAGTNLVLNGGTLQYTGGAASINRLITVATSGGTIDVEGFGALTLNNPGAISHSGSLTLNGNTADTNTLGSALIGGGSVIKSGTGTWVLSGTNGYGGGTTIANGVLQVGANGGTGSLGVGPVSIGTGTTLDFLRTGTVTVPGAITGSGAVSQDGSGTVILANNNGYVGGTTINAGTLQVGNGGGSGSLYVNGPIVNNSLLVFNTAGSFTYQVAGLISGSGNVIFRGGGVIKAIGNNSYTGWTFIDAGTTFFCREGQDGFLVSPVITNSGTLRIVSQDTAFTYAGSIVVNTNANSPAGRVQIGANNNNAGTITLTGTNTYTGGTFIGDNQLILGDGSTTNAGSIVGNVQFVNNFTTADDNARTLTFNRPDDFTFSGTITTNFSSVQNNLGIVQKSGAGTLTLTGNNTYGGGTVVGGGFLVIGNGGGSGSVGFGTVALNSGNPLVINRSGSFTIWGNISGAADLLLKGGATVTLNGVNNSYTGVTTVSNGTLIVNGTNITSSTHVYVGGFGGSATLSGPVTLEPGTTLAPNGLVGPLTTTSDFTNDASAMVFEINKLASPPNDSVTVTGNLIRNATGGTLTVKNLGPHNLLPGDKFTLFSQPLPNGASMTVSGARATWVNNLAVDGSISVATVITTQPALNFTNVTRTNMQFSWSDPFNSFKLQAKTNSLTTNWADYPGGGASPITVPIVKTNGSVFFRLISIP